ncbi:unnamed protein product [Paramecium sonneborni]|uniref:Uncharacterized protein n=1 Tax=Paramecium sonneborni TaxID=65129 RepID=A0A8S1PKN1_9CILI|nr:unnamed protein product [Paramecium sonneborni]
MHFQSWRKILQKKLKIDQFLKVIYIGISIKYSLVSKEFVKEDFQHHFKLLIQKQNQYLQYIDKKFQKRISQLFYDDNNKQSNSYCIINYIRKTQNLFQYKKKESLIYSQQKQQIQKKQIYIRKFQHNYKQIQMQLIDQQIKVYIKLKNCII